MVLCLLARLQSELQLLRRDNGVLRSALCAQTGRDQWRVTLSDLQGNVSERDFLEALGGSLPVEIEPLLQIQKSF